MNYCAGETLDNHEFKLSALIYDYEIRKREIDEIINRLENCNQQLKQCVDLLKWVHLISKETRFYDDFGVNQEKLYEAVGEKLEIFNVNELNHWIKLNCPSFNDINDDFSLLLKDFEQNKENIKFELSECEVTLENKLTQISQIHAGIISLYDYEPDA